MKISAFGCVSLLALAVTSLSTTPALAQNAAPAADSATSGDIVVTAQREKSTLSKTPIAMSAVNGESLRKAGITNPTQLEDASPNLQLTRGGGGLQITIRGVTSTDLTEKGDPSASFLLDGVYLGRPQATEVSFFDIDRVEVLRGPQGTLFGRNTTAGAINVIPNAPSQKLEASVDGSYGNYNSTNDTAMINLPVASNLAVRAAVNYDERDNYVLQGTSPFSLNPGKRNLSERFAIKWDPTSSLSVLVTADHASMTGNAISSVALTNFYTNIVPQAPGSVGTAPIYIGGNASSNQLQTLGFNDSASNALHDNTWGVRGNIKYAITNHLNFEYIGSYRELSRVEPGSILVGEYPTGPGTFGGATVNDGFTGSYYQNTQEARLAYSGDKLKVQVGAYSFHEDYFIFLWILGLNAPNPGQRGYVYGFPQGGSSQSTAFFGQATYSLTDNLRVTAGIRDTKDNKTRIGATINEGNLGDPRDFTTGVQAGETNPDTRTYTYADGTTTTTPSTAHGNLVSTAGHAPYADSLNYANVNYNKITWRAGLEYDLNKRSLLYGTVSTGYKAGGFNDGCQAGAPNCNSPLANAALYYQPELITSYEVGLKTRFADNMVHLNFDYFHYDYTNLQLSALQTICGGPCQVTSNAGKAKVDGVELDGYVNPAKNNRFDFSFTWLDARYTDYQINAPLPAVAAIPGSPTQIATPATPAYPAVNLAGWHLDRSPPITASVGYTLTVPVGGGSLDLNAHTKLTAAYYLLNTTLVAQFRQPSFTKTGLSATYTAPGKHWYVQGYVNNIENKIVVTSAGLGVAFPGLTGGTAGIDDPRTYGVRAGFKF